MNEDITNHGVSLEFLREFAKKQSNLDFLDRIGVLLPVTPNTIRNLAPDQAKAIFKIAGNKK